MMEEIRIIAGNNVSYAILPITPFAEKGKRPRQLNSAYTNRYAQASESNYLYVIDIL